MFPYLHLVLNPLISAPGVVVENAALPQPPEMLHCWPVGLFIQPNTSRPTLWGKITVQK